MDLWYAIVIAIVSGVPAHIDLVGTAPTQAMCEKNLAEMLANSKKVNPPEITLVGECKHFDAKP